VGNDSGVMSGLTEITISNQSVAHLFSCFNGGGFRIVFH
jgi:hypothetical protein